MSSLVLLGQQLRARARTWIIWVVAWGLLLLLFSSVFNSFAKDAAENAKLFEQLPKGIFEALNIDPSLYLTKIEQFFSGQFLFIYMLVGSIFAFSLGSGAIGKRIEDRTIVMLLTKPISRTAQYAVQFITNALFLAAAGAGIGGLAWAWAKIFVTYQASISGQYFFWLFLGTSLMFITIAALGQLIGMIMNGGHSVQIGAGIIVASWFLTALGDFVHIPQPVQVLSLFHYFDTELLRDHFRLDGGLTLILCSILVALLIAGTAIFRKKDIYI